MNAPSASAPAAPAAPAVPTLVAERFESGGVHPMALFPIEGALAVVTETQIGRIADEKIEWIGKIPNDKPAFGGTMVSSVHGRWPDAVDVIYTSRNGRAPEPTFFALTGKGIRHVIGEGGSPARAAGLVRIGESELFVSWTMGTGVEVTTVRGPRLVRIPTSAKTAGCKPGELWGGEFLTDPKAIPPNIVGATPAGTLIWIGPLCEKRAPVAEIWDAEGKSRVVELGSMAKDGDGSFVAGKGDEAWITLDGGKTLLHYLDGKLEPVPRAGRPIQNIFVPAGGALHTNDGTTIHRRDGDRWTPVAHFTWSHGLRALTVDEKGTFWGSSWAMGAVRFRATPTIDAHEGCATPFVFLYDVSSKNAKDFTFPDTRKVLSTFAEVADLRLVEVEEESTRRLGVVVKTAAQGDALMAHVRANMKGEDPTMLCYAPKSPRAIDIAGKPKGK